MKFQLWIHKTTEGGFTLRAYPNNRPVMRPGEKSEDKAAGQNPRRRSQCCVEHDFDPTTQTSGFAAGRNRAGYSDRLLNTTATKILKVDKKN